MSCQLNALNSERSLLSSLLMSYKPTFRQLNASDASSRSDESSRTILHSDALTSSSAVPRSEDDAGQGSVVCFRVTKEPR